MRSKYGENHFLVGESVNFVGERGRRAGGVISGWWKDIYELYWGSEREEGDEIKQFFVRRVGRGDRTNIWVDSWVGENSLKSSFSRLFRLSLQQETKVSEMGSWVNDVWEWNFRW